MTDQIFFKIHIADLFQSTLKQAKLNQKLSRNTGNLLFSNTMGMPGIPDHTKEKIPYKTAASMNILLHAKWKLSTSNGF